MNCQQCRERLPDYLDEALEAAERAQISAHLAACDGCRRELEELRKVAALVGSLDELPVPGGFLQGVRARIERPTVWDRLRGLLVTPRPSVSVAIPVIIVAFVAVFYVMTRPPKTLEQARTQPELKKPGETELAYDYKDGSRARRASEEPDSFGSAGPTEEKAGTHGNGYLGRAKSGTSLDEREEVQTEKVGASDALPEGDVESDNSRLGGAPTTGKDSRTVAGGGPAGGSPGATGSMVVTGHDDAETSKEDLADRDETAGSKEESRRVDTIVKEAGPREHDVTVQFAVLDLGTDLARLRAIAAERGGFVTEQREKEALTALVLNVPVKEFAKAVEQVQLENTKNTEALGKKLQDAEQQQPVPGTTLLLIVRRVEEVVPGQ
jgi:hypothetical protein